MNNTISHPYEWLKTLPSSVLKLDKTPSIGHSPPFPWEELSKQLGALFERPVSITAKEIQMRPPQEFLMSMEGSSILKTAAIQPLEGTVSFALPKSASRTLITYLIKKEEDGLEPFDEEFEESFTQFLALEILHTMGHLDFDKGLSFQLLDDQELPKEPALCIDIEIALSGKSLHGRLILSSALSQSWKERYSQQQFDLLLSSPVTQKIPVIVHLEAGQVKLSPQEWRELKAGDFVILDSCTLQPGDNKGRVMLTVNQRPFMRGKLKDGQLKLLESVALVTGAVMESEKRPEEESEIEEDLPVEEEGEIDLSEEMESEIEEALPQEKGAPEEQQVRVKESLAKLSPETLPMTIVIEVGRIQMPLQKLLELQPGTLLDIDVSLQSGVDLVVNGKKIGKGELLAIGETLGVRITDI